MAHDVGAKSHVGVGPSQGGRQRNEDNYVIAVDGVVRSLDAEQDASHPQVGDGALLVVADGMGGHDHGHVASKAACQVMAKLYKPGAPRDPLSVLVRYIENAHQQLHERAAQRGPVTLGTTLSVVWLHEDVATWAHVGDSRIYLLTQDGLDQLTEDHTLNAFARRDHRTVAPSGGALAQSFIYGSRGLGHDTRLRIERTRDAGRIRLSTGNTLLLCSDGISSVLSNDVLRTVLSNPDSAQQQCEELVELAMQRGSTDNVTAVILRVSDTEPVGTSLADWGDEGEETILF